MISFGLYEPLLLAKIKIKKKTPPPWLALFLSFFSTSLTTRNLGKQTRKPTQDLVYKTPTALLIIVLTEREASMEYRCDFHTGYNS
jgi:hypothetical protein